MTYELKLEKFSGPLAKLLALIEARELPITDISLADVTDDFLHYLRTVTRGGTDMNLVADFIAVASRLILIKSKVLLPELTLTSEEEASIGELEARLKIYRGLRPAMRALAKLWRSGVKEFSRPYLMTKTGAALFYPGGTTDTAALFGSLQRLFEVFENYELETATIKEKIISIEEKVAEIVRRLTDTGETQFRKLAGRRSREEIVAIFLAILHLAREQMILLEQTERFSDIIIRKSSRQ